MHKKKNIYIKYLDIHWPSVTWVGQKKKKMPLRTKKKNEKEKFGENKQLENNKKKNQNRRKLL